MTYFGRIDRENLPRTPLRWLILVVVCLAPLVAFWNERTDLGVPLVVIGMTYCYVTLRPRI